jgi:serine/threonine protein kinase
MDFHPFVPGEVEAALGRRYIVGAEIAVGGQGAVFTATRTSRPDGAAANDVVALKLYYHRSQDFRVQREVAAMEKISHPTLARLIEHGYCEMEGRATRYIAWEFIEGQSLSDRLKSGPLRESEVLPLGRDVAAAIAEIWSRRIVHGDVKPSNIMLKDSGGAVLIDLGAARYFEQDKTLAARRPFGTLGYLSPEQFTGATLSCASDIFSLGVVLLESLLGRHPTNYDQNALADGIRASGGRLVVSTGLLGTLDTMLSTRPTFRPSPAGLSSYFKTLPQRIKTDSAGW